MGGCDGGGGGEGEAQRGGKGVGGGIRLIWLPVVSRVSQGVTKCSEKLRLLIVLLIVMRGRVKDAYSNYLRN